MDFEFKEFTLRIDSLDYIKGIEILINDAFLRARIRKMVYLAGNFPVKIRLPLRHPRRFTNVLLTHLNE